jgi:hypothetical protein
VLAPGLGLAGSLLAILLGTLVGVLLLAAAGVIGSDTGLAAMAALKLSLGGHGAALPAVLNLLQLVGWGAFEIIVMRDAASLLARAPSAKPACGPARRCGRWCSAPWPPCWRSAVRWRSCARCCASGASGCCSRPAPG